MVGDRLFNPKTFGFGMGFILIGAAVVRFWFLGRHSLWIDEAFTWQFVLRPWEEMLEATRLDGVNPPFYYMAVKAVWLLLGESEFSLRFLSALVGTAGVGLAAALGCWLAGRAGAFTAAWLWAFHPMLVFFSVDARPYALATCLALAFWWAFLRLRAGETTFWLWAAAFFSLALGQLTHYFFFLVGGSAMLIAMLEMHLHQGFFRRYFSLWLLALLPTALWVWWYFQQPEPHLGIAWIVQPNIGDPLLTLWNLASGYGGVLSLPTALFGVVTLGLVLAGLVSDGQENVTRKMVVSGVLAPLVGVWLLSMRRPVYVDRYFNLLLPCMAVLAAYGGSRAWQWLHTQKRLWVGVIVVLLGVLGVWAGVYANLAPHYAREDWRGLAQILQTEAEETPRLWLIQKQMQAPLEYYYRQPYTLLPEDILPDCMTGCWWVARQDYTPTHAFTQAVTDPRHPWIPELPAGCQRLFAWDSPTGVLLWQAVCAEVP
jgi:mannosyltransferase